MLWVPKPFQEKAVEFGIERGSAGFFLSPGLGKTSIALFIHKFLLEANQIRCTLVIAPKLVMETVWPKEIRKWDQLKNLRFCILHGSNKDATWHEVLAGKYDLVLINYDGIEWLISKLANMTRKAVFPFDMLVNDESSKLKDTRTKRFKFIKAIIREFKRRLILTGSPAANSLLDLFGQIFIMDQGATFGPYITRYREKYFVPTGYGGHEWVLKPGADTEIYAALSPRVLRLSEKDHLKMPKLMTIPHVPALEIAFEPAAGKAYKQLERHLLLRFADGSEVNAANAAVATNKLLQFTGGAVYTTGDDGAYQVMSKTKLAALRELIEERQGAPTAVAFQYNHEYERLCAELGKFPALKGGLKKGEASQIEADWNEGKIPLLGIHPKAAAHGLNLQDADNALVWYTLPWSYEDYDQLIRRFWRQGRKTPLFVHHLLVKDSVDEVVLGVLHSKEKGQTALLNALRKYWKKHGF